MALTVRAAPGYDSAADALRKALEARGYRHGGAARLVLETGDHGLQLIREDVQPALRLHLDFAAGRQGYRLAHAGHQREGLMRAFGKLPRDGHVLDASAGLGRDTLLLAAHGFRVTAWERHPVVYRLLADALARAATHPDLAPVIQRITLLEGVADPTAVSPPAMAAVFDPMFPERAKRAAVKKDMQLIQALMADTADPDGEQTLAALRGHVERRVIVKRPLHAPALGPDAPQASVKGKSVRFDLYSATGPAEATAASG
ncbi:MULTISPECIES: class I SAM-dependent methyltransferase [unclassified Thioalkalivibrio]|uniref:class I SAM-dependent methyltransferase n=1 Tax=unclassified Thioalkalivibrio TaxID=2621013 RepID=UPI00035E049D|nr:MULTISPECIES: class I SAM-dependent methyltransferase [unclassified Thioalkalivibrio]